MWVVAGIVNKINLGHLRTNRIHGVARACDVWRASVKLNAVMLFYVCLLFWIFQMMCGRCSYETRWQIDPRTNLEITIKFNEICRSQIWNTGTCSITNPRHCFRQTFSGLREHFATKSYHIKRTSFNHISPVCFRARSFNQCNHIKVHFRLVHH